MSILHVQNRREPLFWCFILFLNDTVPTDVKVGSEREAVYWVNNMKKQAAYLHIQTGTPAGQRSGLRSSSAGPSASCRKGWPTRSGTQGLAPEPESPAALGGRTPSGGAALWGTSRQVNFILIMNKTFLEIKWLTEYRKGATSCKTTGTVFMGNGKKGRSWAEKCLLMIRWATK